MADTSKRNKSRCLTPKEKAEQYVQHYYEMLQCNLDIVDLCFRDDSTMIRIDGNMKVTANTVSKIKDLAAMLKDYEIQIESKHCFESSDGGFLVTVWGLTRIKDLTEPKMFLEIFFLAPWKKELFIRSDIFQYFDEESIMQQPQEACAGSSGEETMAYIGNLPWQYDTTKVIKLVEKYAAPENVKIVCRKNKIRGHAIVTMHSIENRDLVINNLNGKDFGDGVLTALKFDKANPKIQKRPMIKSPCEEAAHYVEQYYEMLQKNPDNAHQYFRDNSTMLRICGNTKEIATTILQITNLHKKHCDKKIEIKSRHSLESWHGGVIVIIWGSVHIDTEQKTFLETFFVAPRKKEYFIRSDLFQYVDDEYVAHHPDTKTQEALEQVAALDDLKVHDGDLNTGESRRLFIGNLPLKYDTAKIFQLVRDYAPPEHVQVHRHKKRMSKGYAFVTMRSTEERDLVIENLEGKKCGENVLKVNVAYPRMMQTKISNTCNKEDEEEDEDCDEDDPHVNEMVEFILSLK